MHGFMEQLCCPTNKIHLDHMKCITSFGLGERVKQGSHSRPEICWGQTCGDLATQMGHDVLPKC